MNEPTVRSWQDIRASYQAHVSALDVATTWRKYGWVPPSKECAATMQKQKAFRDPMSPLQLHRSPYEPL